jgi:fumarate reductase subunit D
MASKSLTATFESLPLIAKVLLIFFLGAILCGVYRIVRYTEKNNVVTLIAGVLCFFGLGFVATVVDIITEVLYGKITVLAD